MNTKHTPGPWNTVILNGDRIAVVAHDSSDVATLTHASHADARLIAAAPELLKFLMDAREALFDGNIEEVEGILAGDWCSTVIEGVTSPQEAL